jgi:hypothetical protein
VRQQTGKGGPSLRRPRRTLAYIDEQGLAVCELDGLGRRVVTLIEPAWTTSPGNPNADEVIQEPRRHDVLFDKARNEPLRQYFLSLF